MANGARSLPCNMVVVPSVDREPATWFLEHAFDDGVSAEVDVYVHRNGNGGNGYGPHTL